MKKQLLMFLLALGALLRAEPELPRFLLVAPEGMDAAVVERVQTWMRGQLHYEVEVKRLPMWEGETVAEQVAALPELPREGILVTVVLSERLDEGKHAAIVPDQKLGLINVPLLFPEASEANFRRLERQAIRIVGFSLGVPPQPMPFCALMPYQTLEELDRMGRGFSPPAMAQYRAQLVAAGIPLSPDAERLLPNVRVRPPQIPEAPVAPLPNPND